MKTVLTLLLLLHGVVCDDSLSTKWKEWKNKYHKSYSGSEDDKRFKIWKDNLKIVEEHNRRHKDGESTYEMGMNSLAALTKDEFKSMLMSRRITEFKHERAHNANFATAKAPPATVAWEKTNYVTPVKNQGQLGSCYSFSAVEAVEGQFSLQTNVLVSFSEQQIVDCNQGGDGGYPYVVYAYLIACGGLETEADYPYTGKVSSTCYYNADKAVATLEYFKFVTPFSNETALKAAVANVGPISVSSIKVFASFQLYKSGIYYEPLCNNPLLTGEGYHAMLATGYGTSNGQDYWMVKNSWGTGWGENGYIQMARNRNDNCGIAKQASYPIMTKNQTKMANLGGTGFALSPSVFVILLTSFFSIADISS